MNKKIIRIMMALVVMFFAISLPSSKVRADTLSDGTFTYEVRSDSSGSYAVITAYVGNDFKTVT
jgi:hypothetical protein